MSLFRKIFPKIPPAPTLEEMAQRENLIILRGVRGFNHDTGHIAVKREFIEQLAAEIALLQPPIGFVEPVRPWKRR